MAAEITLEEFHGSPEHSEAIECLGGAYFELMSQQKIAGATIVITRDKDGKLDWNSSRLSLSEFVGLLETIKHLCLTSASMYGSEEADHD
jgi:hypothetical protein